MCRIEAPEVIDDVLGDAELVVPDALENAPGQLVRAVVVVVGIVLAAFRSGEGQCRLLRPQGFIEPLAHGVEVDERRPRLLRRLARRLETDLASLDLRPRRFWESGC